VTIPEGLTKILEELAAKLGTTVEHLWAVTIKQQVMVGWFCFVAGMLLTAVSIATAIYCFIVAQRLRKGNRYGWEYWLFGAALFGLPFVVAIGIYFYDGIFRLANLDYYAFRAILGMLGQ